MVVKKNVFNITKKTRARCVCVCVFLLDYLSAGHAHKTLGPIPSAETTARLEEEEGGNGLTNTGGTDRSYADELTLVVILISQRHLPEPT